MEQRTDTEIPWNDWSVKASSVYVPYVICLIQSSGLKCTIWIWFTFPAASHRYLQFYVNVKTTKGTTFNKQHLQKKFHKIDEGLRLTLFQKKIHSKTRTSTMKDITNTRHKYTLSPTFDLDDQSYDVTGTCTTPVYWVLNHRILLFPGERGEGGVEEHETGGSHQTINQGVEERQNCAGTREKVEEGSEWYNQGLYDDESILFWKIKSIQCYQYRLYILLSSGSLERDSSFASRAGDW